MTGTPPISTVRYAALRAVEDRMYLASLDHLLAFPRLFESPAS